MGYPLKKEVEKMKILLPLKASFNAVIIRGSYLLNY